MQKTLSFLKRNSIRKKWVENATTADIHTTLTKLFVEGDPKNGIGPAITPAELATFKSKFPTIQQANNPLSMIIPFYAGFPFTPLPLPLSEEAYIRAIVILAGRDNKVLDIAQVRDKESKLDLLFRALAGVESTKEDVLDVLFKVQEPNIRRNPLYRDRLASMADRLMREGEISIRTLKIDKVEFSEFAKGVGCEYPSFEGEMSFEAFKRFNRKNPEFLDAIKSKAGALLEE